MFFTILYHSTNILEQTSIPLCLHIASGWGHVRSVLCHALPSHWLSLFPLSSLGFSLALKMTRQLGLDFAKCQCMNARRFLNIYIAPFENVSKAMRKSQWWTVSGTPFPPQINISRQEGKVAFKALYGSNVNVKIVPKGWSNTWECKIQS